MAAGASMRRRVAVGVAAFTGKGDSLRNSPQNFRKDCAETCKKLLARKIPWLVPDASKTGVERMICKALARACVCCIRRIQDRRGMSRSHGKAVRSVLIISTRKFQIEGRRIPEPLLFAHFKMPFGSSNLPGAGPTSPA